MELESQYANSGGDPILDASAADLGSHQRLPRARLVRASAAVLVALGALNMPMHATATTTVFATVPARSVTAAPTGFPGSYLVTDGNNSVFSIGATGGTPTLLANTAFSPFTGASLGSYYGGLSGQYLAAGGQFSPFEGDLAAISSKGTVTPLLSTADGVFFGATVAPSAFGSISRGQVLLTAFNGNVDVLAANGKSVSAFTSIPNIIEPSGIAFAPRRFGQFGGDLFVTDAQTESVYVVKPNGSASLFAGVSLPAPGFPIAAGLPQIAFAPAHFGKYGGDMFVSGTAQLMGGNGTFGDIVVLNGRGQEVATFDEGSVAQPFSPNGLHFAVVNGVTELLATNGGQIDAITASSFKPTGSPAKAPEIDPASAAGALTLLLGALAVLRGRRAQV
jgi:hypothetical protein